MQNSEEDQFLFQTSVQAPVADTISQLACIHNLRHRITRLKLEGEELAKYGPAKHPEKQGIDQYANDQAVEKGEFYCMDPTGRRTGNGKQGSLAGSHQQQYHHCGVGACQHWPTWHLPGR